MKKSLILVVLMCLLCVNLFVPAAFADKPSLVSEGAILMDYKTGSILFEKNVDKKLYPASTTKVMTGIIAIEQLNMDEVVKISQSAIEIDRDGSNMGLLYDEEITIRDLVYGLLVHSANDAANALAENVSGTIDEFVSLMNKKARELGMSNTSFTNTHGYHEETHYTTPRDLAILCRYAMQNDIFRQIVATPQYQIAPTNKYAEIRYLTSNNAMINSNKGHTYLYPYAKGIKTGYTSDAGASLTSFAEKDGLSLICVTMNGETSKDSFTDTISLFEYGFSNYCYSEIIDEKEVVIKHPIRWQKGDDHAIINVANPVSALLPKKYDKQKIEREIVMKEKLTAPIEKGEKVGEIKFLYDGKQIASEELTVGEKVKRSTIKMVFGTIFGFIFGKWVMIPLGTIVVIILIMRTIAIKKAEKRRKRQREYNRQKFYR